MLEKNFEDENGAWIDNAEERMIGSEKSEMP